VHQHSLNSKTTSAKQLLSAHALSIDLLIKRCVFAISFIRIFRLLVDATAGAESPFGAQEARVKGYPLLQHELTELTAGRAVFLQILTFCEL